MGGNVGVCPCRSGPISKLPEGKYRLEQSTSVASQGPKKRTRWDRKIHFCKNEPEKLLKTNDRASEMGQNEPENEPKKLFRISEPIKTKRKKLKTEAI
jgi:hypothetical protein